MGPAVGRDRRAGEGIKVAITSRSQAAADEAAEVLNSVVPNSTIAIESDVRNMKSQQAAVDKVVAEWGQLDYYIANAGVGYFAPLADLSAEQWNETIDVNLTGVFNGIKAAIPALKKTQGYFMTIASLAGTNFFAKGAAYNASKFGLVGFTQAVMMDLRKYGIKATTIMPGSVSTHFNNNTPDDADAWKIQPEDLGQMVVDLLKIHPRSLPSKVEVRPTVPPSAKK